MKTSVKRHGAHMYVYIYKVAKQLELCLEFTEKWTFSGQFSAQMSKSMQTNKPLQHKRNVLTLYSTLKLASLKLTDWKKLSIWPEKCHLQASRWRDLLLLASPDGQSMSPEHICFCLFIWQKVRRAGHLLSCSRQFMQSTTALVHSSDQDCTLAPVTTYASDTIPAREEGCPTTYLQY